MYVCTYLRILEKCSDDLNKRQIEWMDVLVKVFENLRFSDEEPLETYMEFLSPLKKSSTQGRVTVT